MKIVGEVMFPLSHALVVPLGGGNPGRDDISEEGGTGFVVTPRAYHTFLRENNLDEVAEGILAGIDPRSTLELQWAAGQIRELTLAAPLPQALYNRMREVYDANGGGPTALTVWSPDKELLDILAADRLRPTFEANGATDTLRAIQLCWGVWHSWRRMYQRRIQGQRLLDYHVAVYVRRIAERGVTPLKVPLGKGDGWNEDSVDLSADVRGGEVPLGKGEGKVIRLAGRGDRGKRGESAA